MIKIDGIVPIIPVPFNEDESIAVKDGSRLFNLGVFEYFGIEHGISSWIVPDSPDFCPLLVICSRCAPQLNSPDN